MRAGRLVSLLLLLQTRGRMTAQALADELEVSVRTVYRDVESLSASGVPIYADRGPAGGYQLLAGYRTRLTGLTSDEASTLFLAGVPGPAAELGLGSVLAAAQLKLRASLPGELAERADRMRQRFHLDAPGWFRGDEPTPFLAAVADGVWTARQLSVRYRRWKAPREVTRTLSPLGVVLKAGRWYLVATSRDKITAYRVTNILDAEVLDDPVVRPDGFDLAKFWQDWTERYERSVYTATATVRMTARALEFMAFVFPPEMARVARASAGPPDSVGLVTTTVPIESVKHGHTELLKLGADAEVLEPLELRTMLAASARGMSAIYAAAPSPAVGADSARGGGDPAGSGSPAAPGDPADLDAPASLNTPAGPDTPARRGFPDRPGLRVRSGSSAAPSSPSLRGEVQNMTMPDDMLAHNRQLIEEFRADGGASMGNRPLLLLTTLGRRTGKRRTSPMMYVHDGDRLLVIASNNGAKQPPLWYSNLLADPHVAVEIPGHEYNATATPLTGADYERTWAMVKENFPFFVEHEQRAGRQIPVVSLTKAD